MTIAEQLKIKDFPFEIRDKNGRRTYFENSDGHWYRSEYDSNGNLTYYESSSGHWARSEYDSNGNLTYYENSYGIKRGTKRSVDPCDGKTVEIEGKKYKLVAV